MVEPSDPTLAHVARASSDILASKHPAIAQHPQDIGKQSPVVSICAQLIHQALGHSQRHHADPNGTGTGNRLQCASLDPRPDRRRRHPEHLSHLADLGTAVPFGDMLPHRVQRPPPRGIALLPRQLLQRDEVLNHPYDRHATTVPRHLRESSKNRK